MAGKTLIAAEKRRSEKRTTCPTKLTPELLTKMELIIPNIMGQGGSISECALELGVSRETINVWEKKENSMISDIMYKGRLARTVWWEKKGRLNMENEKFSYQGYKWMTMNTIGWSNNQNVDTTVKVSSTVQDASNKRLSKLPKDD